MAGYTIAELPADKKKWKSDFAKPAGQIPTMGQAVFGTRTDTPANPVGQDIGAGARVVANGASGAGRAIGQTARNLDDTRKGWLNIANNLPGAIAAPIATAADSFGADIRTGFTGQKYAGREYVGKPMFGGGEAQAAQPAVVASPANPPIARPVAQGANVARPAAPVAPSAQAAMPAIGKASVSNQQNIDANGVPLPGTGFMRNDQTGKTHNFNAAPAIGAGIEYARNSQPTADTYFADRVRGYNAESDKLMAKQGGGIGEAMVARGMRNMADKTATHANAEARDNVDRFRAIMGNENDQARIGIAKGAQDIQQKQFESNDAYNQERTRGAKMENDRSAITDGLLGEFMGAKDDKTRESALTKLNAINGKGAASDKYITIDVDTGQKDAVGNPIYAKAPFNTRTGQIASTGGAAPAAANSKYAEGDYLRGSDGKAYKVVNGQPVLVQ